MIFFWLIVFVVSLAALVKGADWFLSSAEKVGLAVGLSPFIVGVTIVGAGTSLPELFSSLAAVLSGASEIVAANAIGSNIANILLIVGISALVGRRLMVSKDLIDLDLPLLAISTVLLLGVVWDKQVTWPEAVLLLITYGIYLLYTILHKEDAEEGKKTKKEKILVRPKFFAKDFVLLSVGILGLVFGAKYLIDSVIGLSEIFSIGTGVIAITAVAVGTSLPELLVSVKAVRKGKSEIALGNIFGSNIFNGLVVVGIPGLFKTLVLDEPTFMIGVPALALTTLLFVISGISRRIHIWEGAFFLMVYVLFLAKLFSLF
ncbi:MAG: Na+/Ca+ antiporter, CaCA family [Candidatus Uhrbacteria bacterium GW2011_GWF2_44_350]|uniref:Na+/Ca+ antiporter, CaCA family n=1 Tax=Candidatus Uhrbacteria bacterium GW2011_GWF2_44_350 TaxID=1619000 RepID=A0A0G1JAM6_9BACT|nr:MAG: Na+/Ca+ antiporter, CaCA family [Candidatus Uhrbacteria bacterium GW2011_GWF2_44_350]HBR80144.1 conjugal transfer protein TraR [Candidatus Uhrbacteria bacterium]HCU31333.1 conjugal transfer protein TraR [Candidatus Uhrbacteria bacterium]